jgi:hypothetical protein
MRREIQNPEFFGTQVRFSAQQSTLVVELFLQLVNDSIRTCLHIIALCVVHLLSEGSGLRAHRRTYLLRPLMPELDGQDVEASSKRRHVFVI